MQNQKWPPLTTTIVTQIEFELLNVQFSKAKLQIWKYDHKTKELDDVFIFFNLKCSFSNLQHQIQIHKCFKGISVVLMTGQFYRYWWAWDN